jgi:protein-tyrosine phosphatase
LKVKTRVLFVCTENICRSPLAEGLMRHHLKLAGLAGGFKVGSAGTSASQPGARPDQRARDVAAAAGINLGKIRARRVTNRDFELNNLILAMDNSHIGRLIKICPPEHHHKISLLLDHDPGQSLKEVPDPYYGSYEGFVEVFQIIERAVVALIPHMGTLGPAGVHGRY